MDALASVAFSVIAVTTLNQLGFSSKKEYIKTIWLVGIVVALGFSVLYIGLGYLGNHFPIPASVMASDSNKRGVCIIRSDQSDLWSDCSDFPSRNGDGDLLYHNCWFNRLYQ